MIPYILHVSILLAGCYIFYWLFLRQETFFQLNRGVLLACLLVPMVLPLVTIPASWSLQIISTNEISNNISTSIVEATPEDIGTTFTQTESKVDKAEKTISTTPINTTKNIKTSEPAMSIYQMLSYGYIAGVIVFMLAFFIQLILILAKMSSLNSMQDGKYRIVELVKDEAPYSFWNTIFINPSKYDADTYEQILAHEKIHIDQTHFVDKLLVELMVIAFWFNPFVWLFRKAITNNLEFLTDESMLTLGFPKQSYQMSLLKVSVPQYPLHLTTNYNQSFLKNRIAMMNTKKSSARSVWKYLFILPLLGFSVMSLNAVEQNSPIIDTETIDNEPVIEAEEVLVNEEANLLDLTDENNNEIAKEKEINNNTITKQEITQTEEDIYKDKLKTELMTNLEKDNLLDGNDPVFKLFPDRILLNEKRLNEKLRKKYLKIFKKYDITPDDSRLLIVKPLVIMSGSFIGNGDGSEGTHVDIYEDDDNIVITGDTHDRSGQHTDGRVMVETINGRTYVHGQGTHHINGQVVTNTGNETRVIEKDGRTYVLEGDALQDVIFEQEGVMKIRPSQDQEEFLSGMEKHYLESSKGDGNWRKFGKPSTVLTASNNEYWKLPAFCEALQKELVNDEIIDKGDKIMFVMGGKGAYVNGWHLSGGHDTKYVNLARKFNIPIGEGWNLELDGKRVLITGQVSDIEQLRIDLLKELVRDDFISNKNKDVVMKIHGNRMLVNGEDISNNKLAKYHQLLFEHGLTPAPDKIIMMKKENGKKFMHVGYGGDGSYLGTFMTD